MSEYFLLSKLTKDLNINDATITIAERKRLSNIPGKSIKSICEYFPSYVIGKTLKNISKIFKVSSNLVISQRSTVVEYLFRKHKSGECRVVELNIDPLQNIKINENDIALAFPKNWKDTQYCNTKDYFKLAFKGVFSKQRKGKKLIFQYDSSPDDLKTIPSFEGDWSFHYVGSVNDNMILDVTVEYGFITARNEPGFNAIYHLLQYDNKETYWIKGSQELGEAIISPSIVNLKDGTILMFGGHEQDEKEVFDKTFKGVLNEDEDDMIWTPMPKMVSRRLLYATFKLQNKVYVVGGMDGDYADTRRATGKWTKTLQIFDVEKEEWTLGPDMPIPIQQPAALLDKNKEVALIYGIKADESGDHKRKYGNTQQVRTLFIFNEDIGYIEHKDVLSGKVAFGDEWEMIHRI